MGGAGSAVWGLLDGVGRAGKPPPLSPSPHPKQPHCLAGGGGGDPSAARVPSETSARRVPSPQFPILLAIQSLEFQFPGSLSPSPGSRGEMRGWRLPARCGWWVGRAVKRSRGPGGKPRKRRCAATGSGLAARGARPGQEGGASDGPGCLFRGLGRRLAQTPPEAGAGAWAGGKDAQPPPPTPPPRRGIPRVRWPWPTMAQGGRAAVPEPILAGRDLANFPPTRVAGLRLATLPFHRRAVIKPR